MERRIQRVWLDNNDNLSFHSGFIPGLSDEPGFKLNTPTPADSAITQECLQILHPSLCLPEMRTHLVSGALLRGSNDMGELDPHFFMQLRGLNNSGVLQPEVDLTTLVNNAPVKRSPYKYESDPIDGYTIAAKRREQVYALKGKGYVLNVLSAALEHDRSRLNDYFKGEGMEGVFRDIILKGEGFHNNPLFKWVFLQAIADYQFRKINDSQQYDILVDDHPTTAAGELRSGRAVVLSRSRGKGAQSKPEDPYYIASLFQSIPEKPHGRVFYTEDYEDNIADAVAAADEYLSKEPPHSFPVSGTNNLVSGACGANLS